MRALRFLNFQSRKDFLEPGLSLSFLSAAALIFFNACQAARPGLGINGLSGWARHLVRGCGCGGFIAPLWSVNHKKAHTFAATFYDANGAFIARLTMPAQQKSMNAGVT